jgi:hypothetical protein
MQAALQIVYFAGRGDGRDPPPGPRADRSFPAPFEDLPYRVEVWDEAGARAETLVAVSISASLAYAAYYAAAREFFGRDVTITHKGATLARWRIHRN